MVVDVGVYVPHQGAAVPDSRSLSWSFTFSAVFFAVAGSCFSRLPALARVPMGSSFTHERSTTFPWVASRTVQVVYDLSGLRGPVVRLYHCIRGMGVRMSNLCYLYL
jgi:hypothetical protein